jgi:glycosyltransferase involved in cell wall biosynthesis
MNETSKPMITTIIPTYRRPQQLKQAIISVLNQTYPHFQVCVYDNASGDDTALVVAEIAKADTRVKYYCHKENIGAFNNFQFGLMHVETPFFSFLSDDDLVLPKFYETALAGFEKYPEVMLSATVVVSLDDKGNFLEPPAFPFRAGFYQSPQGLLTMLKYHHPTWTGSLFRREVIEYVGILDEEVGMASDLDFELRLAAHFPVFISQEYGAIFFNYNGNGVKYGLEFIWPGWLKMIRNLTDDKSLDLDVRTYAERILRERLEKRLFELSISYLSRGCFADAKKVAALLRDQFCGWIRYIALSVMISACQYVPFARSAFGSLVACRRCLRAKRIQSNQRRYRENFGGNRMVEDRVEHAVYE